MHATLIMPYRSSPQQGREKIEMQIWQNKQISRITSPLELCQITLEVACCLQCCSRKSFYENWGKISFKELSRHSKFLSIWRAVKNKSQRTNITWRIPCNFIPKCRATDLVCLQTRPLVRVLLLVLLLHSKIEIFIRKLYAKRKSSEHRWQASAERSSLDQRITWKIERRSEDA